MARGSARALSRHRGVLLVCALIQAAAGWIATQAYLVENNNLAANGNWVVSKTRLEKGLMGAYSFLSGRQSLAGGGLHLDAWHGFQEVVVAGPLRPVRAIEFDAVFARGSWLVVSFNRDGSGPYDAVRLSRHPRHPSAILRVDEDGLFRSYQPLASDLLNHDGRHRIRLEIEPERALVLIDGRQVGEAAATRLAAQTVGLRGGLRPVAVDNVEIAGRDGIVLRDGFSGPANRHLLAAAAGGGLVLLNVLFFLVLSRFLAAEGRKLGFAFLMVSLTLLVCVGLLFAFVRVRVSWYPGQGRVLAQSEEFYRKGEEDRVVTELLERLQDFSGQRSRRILFVGSSQTWGAGARRDEDAFVHQIEDLLNRPFRKQRFVCLNLGVSAARARDLLPLVKALLPKVKPGLVVINLSSNDRASRGFADFIRKMVQRVTANGARTLLVLEPNAPGTVDAGLLARHHELRALAEEFDLPLVDLQGHLSPLEDTGFLWWDKVHLTNYGQRLVAERLHQEIVPLLGEKAVRGEPKQKSRSGVAGPARP